MFALLLQVLGDLKDAGAQAWIYWQVYQSYTASDYIRQPSSICSPSLYLNTTMAASHVHQPKFSCSLCIWGWKKLSSGLTMPDVLAGWTHEPVISAMALLPGRHVINLLSNVHFLAACFHIVMCLLGSS